MKRQLHPRAKWLFRIKVYVSMIFLGFFISWFIAPIFVVIMTTIMGVSNSGAISLTPVIIGLIVFAIFYIILMIIIAEIYARMSYKRWFYEFTDHQLRIERGIIWKRYSNIPYERIQNVDITRGIIARMLGFSSVNIQTAGFSYSPNKMAWAEGYIPGVSAAEAEHIREYLMTKITKKGRSQGL